MLFCDAKLAERVQDMGEAANQRFEVRCQHVDGIGCRSVKLETRLEDESVEVPGVEESDKDW